MLHEGEEMSEYENEEDYSDFTEAVEKISNKGNDDGTIPPPERQKQTKDKMDDNNLIL